MPGFGIFFYMKYSANRRRISSFVVGRAGSEYGLPMAVYMFLLRFFRIQQEKVKSSSLFL